MGRTVRRSEHREIFFAINGLGPYECFECKQEVTFDEVLVHHDDENHANNDPTNLLPAHDSCHKRHHGARQKRSPTSAATREKISLAQAGKPKTAEHRAKIATTWQTPETKAKAAAARLGKPLSPAHRASISRALRGRSKTKS